METLRYAIAFVVTPVFYVIDWLLNDKEYEQLIAEQHLRNVERSFENY